MFTLYAMLKGFSTSYECWPAQRKVWDPKHSGKTPTGWWTDQGYSRVEIESMEDFSGIHAYLDTLTKEEYYEWKASMRQFHDKMSKKYEKDLPKNLFLDFNS